MRLNAYALCFPVNLYEVPPPQNLLLGRARAQASHLIHMVGSLLHQLDEVYAMDKHGAIAIGVYAL